MNVPLGADAARAGARAADEAARRFLGDPRAIPPAPAWPLTERIAEAAGVDDARLVEGHAEVAFRAMRGAPLAHSKWTWSGLHERLALLHAAGLRPTRSFGGAGKIGPDDVLDATALAWTAARVARGDARTLPQDARADERPGRVAGIRY